MQFPQLELHRRGVGLVAAPGTTESAIHVEMEKARPLRSCTCAASRRKTCDHLKELSRQLAQLGKLRDDWEAYFAGTAWYRLARLVYDAQPAALADVRVTQIGSSDGSLLRVASARGDELACGGSSTCRRWASWRSSRSWARSGASRRRRRCGSPAAACRVFLGSLKAGGTGFDLVGGSVVIHYDRWWNAAREDQATDRVHRIGQHRAVQVFKLLTEGTLEEKIAAIIERKRELMEGVVEEDDPRLAKIFTREELLELLSPPGSSAPPALPRSAAARRAGAR